jgi:hypothetical protein
MPENVVSISDWERMKRSVGPSTVNDQATRRKEELKKLSSDRYQHWPNTLDAVREKKLNFVAEKAREEELARQEVDRHVSILIAMFCLWEDDTLSISQPLS